VSSEKTKLSACVKHYNELCAAYGGDDSVHTSIEEIMEGDFPWSSLTGLCTCMHAIWHMP